MGPVEELLRKAWKLIENPENRCVKLFSVDVNGYDVEPDSSRACKWCSLGAIDRYFSESKEVHSKAHRYLIKASDNLGNHNVAKYNDSDIVNNPPKLYAEAIRLAEKDGV